MSARKVIRFGVIGAGLMGKEFASAAARWCHLLAPGKQFKVL
jgi:predicted homoserine dehydrogenase-like protein